MLFEKHQVLYIGYIVNIPFSVCEEIILEQILNTAAQKGNFSHFH